MCGIAGILGRPDRISVESMIEAMARRGPDDSGVYEDQHVVLGHRRLSVLDLTKAGHQPMSRASGRLWVVYNGEVYNFMALRRDLEARGHRFASATDTEVILALYEDQGIEGITRLRGMFALAIWDVRGAAPLLVLARDHFGIKPLLYAETARGLEFASDLPGLLAGGGVARDVDPVALVQYLMHGHVVSPRTIIKGVTMLLPGHILTARPGEAPRLRCYWSLDAETCAALSRGHGYQDQVARLRGLLERAAGEQMVSDVPLGAFLSGGIDSTALVALMTRAAGRPIHTYSIGFPDAGAAIDESGDAERSAGYLGSVHRSVRVRGQDVAEALPRIAADLGQPTVDGVNMHFVSGAARSGVTVALTGMGGDELFAGYATFPVLAGFNRPRARARRALRGALGAPGRWLRARTAIDRAWDQRVMNHGFSAAYTTFRMLRAPCDAWRMAARPAIDAEAVLAYTDADDASLDDPVRRVTALESKLYMSSQLLRDTDAASMAHSLEVRVPLLDIEVSEYAYGLPADSKLLPGAPRGALPGKRVLIDAVRDVIPDWVWRKPKRGFSMPFGEWLRGPVRDLAEETLWDREFRQQGWIDGREAEREWRRFLDDHTAHWGGVWTVMMLALWWRHGLMGTAARSGRTGGGMAESMGMQGAR